MSNEHIDISKIRQGNEFAFVQFYRQYAQQAYLMSYKYLGNKDLAEDAVQELFVKLWEHRAELDDDESVGGFVFTMLKHLLLDTPYGTAVRICSLSSIIWRCSTLLRWMLTWSRRSKQTIYTTSSSGLSPCCRLNSSRLYAISLRAKCRIRTLPSVWAYRSIRLRCNTI